MTDKTNIDYCIKTHEFDIYPNRGEVVSRKNHFNAHNGEVIKTKSSRGYLQMGIDGNTQRQHRVIYELYHAIKLNPNQQINHINHNRADNRISNLELVTGNQNQQWRKKTKRNKSGWKGVQVESGKDTFRAAITFRGKPMNLGRFHSKRAAAFAYNLKAEELNERYDCKYLLNRLKYCKSYHI
jgi:HNH endonuclease